MKLELAWQGFSDFDSINRSADENGVREIKVAMESHADPARDGKSIVICAWIKVFNRKDVSGCEGIRGSCLTKGRSRNAQSHQIPGYFLYTYILLYLNTDSGAIRVELKWMWWLMEGGKSGA